MARTKYYKGKKLPTLSHPLTYFHLQECSITVKLRLMKSFIDTDSLLKPTKQEINDVKHRIKIPSNALYLFENDFIEIDVPLNELTIR